MTLDQLNLSVPCRAAAQALLAAAPGVVFTSGRRSLADQARAMASNVVQNRNWIAQTYKPSLACSECQSWVTENPSSNTAQAIYFGLIGVLTRLPIEEAGKISKHLSGDAFDVQPVDGPAGDAIKAALEKIVAETPGSRVLWSEGGLRRWHFQL